MRPVAVSQRLMLPSASPMTTRLPHAAIAVATPSAPAPTAPQDGRTGLASVTCALGGICITYPNTRLCTCSRRPIKPDACCSSRRQPSAGASCPQAILRAGAAHTLGHAQTPRLQQEGHVSSCRASDTAKPPGRGARLAAADGQHAHAPVAERERKALLRRLCVRAGRRAAGRAALLRACRRPCRAHRDQREEAWCEKRPLRPGEGPAHTALGMQQWRTDLRVSRVLCTRSVLCAYVHSEAQGIARAPSGTAAYAASLPVTGADGGQGRVRRARQAPCARTLRRGTRAAVQVPGAEERALARERRALQREPALGAGRLAAGRAPRQHPLHRRKWQVQHTDARRARLAAHLHSAPGLSRGAPCQPGLARHARKRCRAVPPTGPCCMRRCISTVRLRGAMGWPMHTDHSGEVLLVRHTLALTRPLHCARLDGQSSCAEHGGHCG